MQPFFRQHLKVGAGSKANTTFAPVAACFLKKRDCAGLASVTVGLEFTTFRESMEYDVVLACLPPYIRGCCALNILCCLDVVLCVFEFRAFNVWHTLN